MRRFVDTEVRPHVAAWEAAGHFPDTLFRRCGELGFLGLHYPARWGGSGGDLAAGIVFIEELARCGAGAIPMAIGVQTDMATPALAEFGTDDQRERWLRPAIAGTKIGAIAITEPDAGSDVAAISTRAVDDGDGFRLDGVKTWISNGGLADFYVVFARTADDGGRGLSAFIVDADAKGVDASERIDASAPHPLGTLRLSGCRIPRDAMLGAPGDGFRIARTIATLYRIERPLWFFGAIGLLLALIAVVLAVPIVITYLHTGLVPRFPTAILATGLVILASLCLFSGLILDTVVRGRREVRRLAYLAHPAPGSGWIAR